MKARLVGARPLSRPAPSINRTNTEYNARKGPEDAAMGWGTEGVGAGGSRGNGVRRSGRYALDRLNVATSRARVCTVVVASPKLLVAECRRPRQMRLVNAVLRYAELAQPLAVES